MRAFIAIELPEDVKSWILEYQTKLKDTRADVKWVEPHNFHITLKFLGEINQALKEKIAKILKETLQERVSFLVSISQIGVFPKISHPRVIWLGIKEGEKEIKEMAKELEEKINLVGIPREKKEFTSHITIGRVRSPKNQNNLITEIKRISQQNLYKDFWLKKIILFESILTSRGPNYKSLEEISLRSS